MKILKYITAVFALIFAMASCEKEVENPVLNDSDYRVYFYGSGENIYNVAREGYDVYVGDSVQFNLMNSPTENTEVKWVDSRDTTIINRTFNYTYKPTEVGSQKTWFVSSRPSGFTDTVVFNLNGVFNGADLELDEADWTLAKKRVDGTFNPAFGSYKHLFAGVRNFGGEYDLVSMMPFALPSIPAGKKIKTATLKINMANVKGVGIYDLHILNEARTEPTVLNSDFYVGSFEGSSNSTPVQSEFITSSTPVGELLESNEISAEMLAEFINNLYDNGAEEGDFIFLRVNASTDNLTSSDYIEFKSSVTDVVGTEPIISITYQNL